MGTYATGTNLEQTSPILTIAGAVSYSESFKTSSFSAPWSTGSTFALRDNAGDVVEMGYSEDPVEGSATLIVDDTTQQLPEGPSQNGTESPFTFTHTFRSTGQTKTFVITSVSQSRSAGDWETIDITFTATSHP